MEKIATEKRREWVSPEVVEIEAGAAESQQGNTQDGGGGFQGS